MFYVFIFSLVHVLPRIRSRPRFVVQMVLVLALVHIIHGHNNECKIPYLWCKNVNIVCASVPMLMYHGDFSVLQYSTSKNFSAFENLF